MVFLPKRGNGGRGGEREEISVKENSSVGREREREEHLRGKLSA